METAEGCRARESVIKGAGRSGFGIRSRRTDAFGIGADLVEVEGSEVEGQPLKKQSRGRRVGRDDVGYQGTINQLQKISGLSSERDRTPQSEQES